MSDRARAGSDPANRGGSRAAIQTRAEHGAGGTEGRQRLRSPRPDAALLGGGKPGRDAAVDQPSSAQALGGAGTRCGHCWEQCCARIGRRFVSSRSARHHAEHARAAPRSAVYAGSTAAGSRGRVGPKQGQTGYDECYLPVGFLSLNTDSTLPFAAAADPRWIRQAVAAARHTTWSRLGAPPGCATDPVRLFGRKADQTTQSTVKLAGPK
jgi:hypothetical protein